MKKTYYVFKSTVRFGYVDSIVAEEGHRGGYLRFVSSVQRAQKFINPAEALTALQKHARYGDSYASDLALVRVEETPGTSRRELVTKGDLSLLDTNPVVLFGAFILKFVGHDGSWSANDVEQARVFDNQGAALSWYAEQERIGGAAKVRPIREITAEPTITETVLA